MSTDGPASEPPTAPRPAPEPDPRERPGRGAGSGHGAEPELRDPIEKLDAQRQARRQNLLVTLAWMLHWVLRMGLAAMLLVYGWSKVVLMQMGLGDYGDALTQFGEMSPMGLLWRFMAYAPVVQCLAGVAEVLAAALLLFRRTVWLGALLAVADMAVVFLLNMAYDVPVKQLAGIMGVAGIVILLPFLPRLLRFAAGRATGPALLPTPIPWPRLARFTRWLGAIVAVAAVAGSGAVFVWSAQGTSRVDGPLPGVYRVVEDAREPAAQLAEDDRWQQVAFGQWDYYDGRGRVGIRYANGDFQGGTYRLDGDTVTLSLDRIREGSQPLGRNDYVAGFDLTWEELPDGRIALTGDRVDIVIESDAEARYLFDRDFSWDPRPPINR